MTTPLTTPTSGARSSAGAAEPSAAELLRYYHAMVLTRAYDQQMVVLQRQGKIGFTIPCEGEEACHVGAAACLDPKRDWIFPSYRQQGMAIYLGVPIAEMLHQMFNTAKDVGSRGRQMPVHFSFVDPIRWVSISSPLGTQIPQAVGAARAMRQRGEDGVVVACFGDGSTSSNGFHSGMTFAGVWKAPVIFLCDNNGWAISCPTSQQTASESFAIKGKAYGIPGVVVDGNDVLAVRRTMAEAVDRARSGGGPTLIEAVTYRIGGHSSSDDPRRYRSEAEVAAWKQRDPIARFETWLREKGILNDEVRERAAAEAKAKIQAAVDEVASTPPPGLETLFDDVYADLTPRLRVQRDECLARFARHGESDSADGAFPL